MNRLFRTGAVSLLLLGAFVLQSQASAASAQAAAAQEGAYMGILADAACKEKTPSDPCPANASTSSFGILTQEGEFVRFDAEGNRKAKGLVSSASGSGPLNVRVTGNLQGDVLQVTSIETI